MIQGKRTTVSYKNHKIRKKNKKEWIRKENTHEAIVDTNTFNKVQLSINERTKPMRNKGIVHNFSGKVFCMECKKYMRKKSSKLHEYLVCSNNTGIYSECINKSSIRYDCLEDIILKLINNKIKEYYDETYLLQLGVKNKEKIINDKISLLENQKSVIKKKLDNIRKYLKSLYEDKVNGIISIEYFKELVSDYIKNENVYNKQINAFDSEISFYKSKIITSDDCNVFRKYKSLKKLNKIIVDEFIDKIYISKLNKEKNERTIEIKWNISTVNIL